MVIRDLEIRDLVIWDLVIRDIVIRCELRLIVSVWFNIKLIIIFD